MAALAELLGTTLLKDEERVDTSEVLAGKGAVALYFSAHWCPPCRGFTPKLAEWYKKDLSDKGLEVVFVSSDKDEAGFKEYYKEQPWLALPYDARDKKAELSKKFKVQGIPSLVILDSEGKTITTDGRKAVSEDPTGDEFPWRPPKIEDVMGAAKIVNGAGNELSLQQVVEGKKAIALYFSAHWCPPCRGFTPQLVDWYKKDLSDKGLEVIFVSWDRDEAQYKEYFAEMPWLSISFDDQKTVKQLNSCFNVEGIPNLVILDTDLKTINAEGRGAVSSDPTGKEFPWYPKPVNDLTAGPGSINEVPTVLVLCETSDADEKEAIEATLGPIGQRYLDKQKATDSDLEFSFMTAKSSEGLAPRVRGMLSLPSIEDGAKLAPQLVLIDIPSDGAFYVAPADTAITTEAVEQFLADYSAGKLERKQLS